MRKGLLKVVFLDHWGQTVWDCWIFLYDYFEMAGVFADGMKVEKLCSDTRREKILDTPGLWEWREQSGMSDMICIEPDCFHGSPILLPKLDSE
jgi:hypothetical protein